MTEPDQPAPEPQRDRAPELSEPITGDEDRNVPNDSTSSAEDATEEAPAEGASAEGDPPTAPTGAALAAVANASRPERPPRRTGVFVDPEDLRTHVGSLLRAVLGGYEVDAFGNFTFVHEDARVFVTVGGSPVGPHVGVFCVTNVDVDLGPELARFLLTTNHGLGFGSFSYDAANRAVWLRHTLLGTTLDLPELQAAVAAIATTAAHLDEDIRDRFGGRTFHDAPDDVQRGMEPPSGNSEPGPGGASGYL